MVKVATLGWWTAPLTQMTLGLGGGAAVPTCAEED